MTAGELLRSMFRRWYVVLVGLVVTAAVLWPTTHRPGVYWTQFNVVLLPPVYAYFPNKLENPQYSLGPLAGVIASDFNGNNRPLLTASPDTTLFGIGQRAGVQVRVPNLGNQWTPYYPSPTIDVQVVDIDPALVSAESQRVVSELKRLLDTRQDQQGIDPSMRVSILASPSDPSVYYTSGSRMRTGGAVCLVGLLLTITAVYWVEQLATRQRKMSARVPTRTARSPRPVAPRAPDADSRSKTLEPSPG